MIKNYTSSTPAAQSVDKIEKMLVEAGAVNVMKLFSEKRLSGIAFILSINGKQYPIKLPAKTKESEELLLKQVKRPRSTTRKLVLAQAERTAWKILADWVELQITLIKLKHRQPLEAFFSDIYDIRKNETFYESLKNSGGLTQLEYRP